MSNNLVNKRRIAKNTIALYFKVIINTLVAFYTTRVILNSLGEVDYGVYGVVGGAIAMLGVINTALAQTTQRFLNYAEGEDDIEKQRRQFNAGVVVHFILGLAILLFIEILYFPLFNGVLNIPEERIAAAKIIYHMMAVSTFFTILTVPYDASINAHEDLIYYSIVGIFEAIAKLAIAMVVVYTFYDKLITYGLMMAFLSIILMIVMRVYCKRKYNECVFSPKQYLRKDDVMGFGKFAGWNFLGVFSNIFGNYGTDILLNHFFGTIIIAAQTISNQMAGVLSTFSSNLLKALNPVIVKSEGAGNRQGMLNLSMNACRISFFLYSFFAIPFIFEADFLLKLWLGNVPQWAVLFAQLNVAGVMIEQICNPVQTTLMAEGHIKEINFVTFILGVSNFLILLLFFHCGCEPYWRYITGVCLITITRAMFTLAYSHKYCSLDVSFYLRNVLQKTIPCAACTFAILFILKHNCVMHFHQASFMVVLITLSTVTLAISIWLLGLTTQERMLIKNKILKLHE